MLESINVTLNLNDLTDCSYSDLALDSNGYIRYKGQKIAALYKSDDFYLPDIALDSALIASAQQAGEENLQLDDIKKAIIPHLENFLYQYLSTHLSMVFTLRKADNLCPEAQIIADKLIEKFGIIRRSEVADTLSKLQQFDRSILRNYQVRFGRFHVYFPDILKPNAVKLLFMLWDLPKAKQKDEIFLASDAADNISELREDLLLQSMRGRTTLKYNEKLDKIYYLLAGYDFWQDCVIRVDITERLSNYIQSALNWRPEQEKENKPEGAYNGWSFVITPRVLSTLGLSYDKAALIFEALGYHRKRVDYDEVNAPFAVQIKPENKCQIDAQDNACQQEQVTEQVAEPITADVDAKTFMDIWRFNKVKKERPPRIKQVKSANKKHKNKANISYKASAKKQEIDPDSPFAVLMTLRDQIK